MRKKKKQILNVKKVFVAGIVVILGVATLKMIPEKSVPHQNSIDTQISLNSGRQISPNTTATNPEFKHIAFDTAIPSKTDFSDQVATVIEAIKSLIPSLFEKKEEGVKEYGSWIWTPVLNMSSEYMESILSGAKKNDVNVMYVSIDSYLDIFVMKNGREKEELKKEFSEKLNKFISIANSKGMAVDAEAGWQNWAEDGNLYKSFAVVEYVKDFNAKHENKFRGFQYDVEPYLLDAYKKDPAPVLRNFVRLVDMTGNFIGADALKFSVVVPDFYDKRDGLTKKFSYNGRSGYILEHLLRVLDRRQGSSIIVMSYRNFADGRDGAIEVSKNEMRTVRRASNTKIIIAQETGDVPPPYITFHDTSKKYLSEQIEKINTTFKPYQNFGGIAVHYVNAFLALK